MSNINLYQSYLNKVRKFGVNDSLRFRASYVEAVNLVYAEINDLVFQNQILPYIDYFNDVIDTRLKTLTDLTYGFTCNAAIGDREYWSAEWEFEKTSAINSFTDTIEGTVSDVVVSIVSNTLTITGDTVIGSMTLPVVNVFTLKVISDEQGLRVYINGDEYGLTYTGGDEDTSQAIGTVASHIINNVTGFEIKRTRFLTDGTVVFDFAMDRDDDALANLTDKVAEYTATLTGQQWDARWIEPSSGLDSQYRASFDMGIDYHLQDGGEWAIEAEGERERKWYTRGIKNARNVFQNNTTYISPLNIPE